MNFTRTAAFTLALSLLAACGGGGDAPQPASGPQSSARPALGPAIDTYAKASMQTYGATAVTVAVMKNGAVLHEAGYGFRDAAKTQPLPADALFRTASVIKPVTAAAIRELAAKGRLALSDRVFCTGENMPCVLPQSLLSAGYDVRIKDMTVAHLIAHRAGWDRTVGRDSLSIEPYIRDKLGLQRPATRQEIIRYMMSFPLDSAPGTRVGYANFGYLLLGEILDQVSKTDYIAFVYPSIMAPLGVNAADFKQAHTRLAERDAREPVYVSTLMSASVYTPGAAALAMDEGALLEHASAVVGVITTARALALFAAAYSLPDGAALAGKTGTGVHNGSLPGLSTLVRQLDSGVTYAIMINTSVPDGGYDKLIQEMDAAIAASGY